MLAEGIETKEQRNALIKMGCQYVQGFYFSKPPSVVEAPQFLIDHNLSVMQKQVRV